MKTTKLFVLLSLGVVVGLLATCWAVGQPLNHASHPAPVTAPGNLAQDELTALVASLEAARATNTLKLFGAYSKTALAQRDSADLGMTVAVLQRLRDGRPDEAVDLLETRLDGVIIDFVACYRQLEVSKRDQFDLQLLRMARDYRAKHPHKWPGHPEMEWNLNEAFALLEQTGN